MMQLQHRPAEGAANVCRVRESDHNRVLFYFYLTFILSVNWVQKAQVPKAEQTGWWTFHQLNISVWGKIQNIKQTMWNIKISIASDKYESSVYNKWYRILKYEFILDVEYCYIYSKSWNYPLIIFQKMANVFLPDKVKWIIRGACTNISHHTVSVSVAGAIWEYECRSQN